MYFLCIVTTLLLLVLFVYILSLYREYTNPLRILPGMPLTNPIFGTMLEYRRSDGRLIDWIKDKSSYGKVRKNNTFFGSIRLVINDPDWIKYVLIENGKNFTRGSNAGAAAYLYAAVGDNGLIVIGGEQHKRLRKLISPAFKISALRKLMPAMEKCGQRLVNLIREACRTTEASNGTEIVVKEYLNKATLDLIGLAAFGHDFRECCSFRTDTFGYELRKWFDFQLMPLIPLPLSKGLIRALLAIARHIPHFSVPLIKALQTTNKCHDLISEILESKIQNARSERKMDNQANSNSKSLLDFILDGTNTGDITKQELHDVMMTLLIAGHETSSVSITWSLYLLAQHPKCQTKCRKEVEQLFAKKDSNLEWEDMKNLTFLNAVVFETLRLYPSIPWFNRSAINSDVISGYNIPAGTDVLIISAELHRNGEYWHDPDLFMPERFLEPQDSIPWHAFLPFAEGVHKCIGYQLALTEICYLLAVMIRNFEFSIDPNLEYHEFALITMQPKPALKLFFHPLLN